MLNSSKQYFYLIKDCEGTFEHVFIIIKPLPLIFSWDLLQLKKFKHCRFYCTPWKSFMAFSIHPFILLRYEIFISMKISQLEFSTFYLTFHIGTVWFFFICLSFYSHFLCQFVERTENKWILIILCLFFDKLWRYGGWGRGWTNKIVIIINAFIRKSINSTFIIIVFRIIKTTT